MQKTYFTVLYAILVVYWFRESSCASGVNPIWVTNSFFETNPAQVKADVLTTFNSTNPITKTFTFTKTYTQIPHLAFGIKNYRGNDQLGSQNFAITRTGLTMTGFTVYTMIDGITNIRILTIIYLAVDRSFLYHLNVFNDIPANYSNGNLANITGNQIGVRQYRNVINYTILANSISSTHTLFGLNMAKNKVALFLNAIYNKGNRTAGLTVKYSVTTQVLSADQFEIVVVCQPNYLVDLIRFSLVAMDIDDIQKSGKYTVVSYYVELPATSDQYIAIPRQFATNTLIGLVDFTTVNAYYGLEFNWEFDLSNDRIIFNQSLPYTGSSALGGLTAFRADILYVKTWYCPSATFYNLTDSLCYFKVCGNGIWEMSYQGCDDGNNLDGDGCDHLCNVQPNFICLVTDQLPSGASFCKLKINSTIVTLEFSYYEMQTTSNTLHIFFNLNPGNLSEWNQSTINNLINSVQLNSQPGLNSTLIPLKNYTIQYHPNSQNNQVEFIIVYENQSIEDSYLTFNIAPNNTNIPSILNTPSSNFTLHISSNSNALNFCYYPSDLWEFKSNNIIKILSYIVGILSLIFILLGFFIPVGRLIIVQALAVVQIAFFSILQLNKVPPTFEDLKFLINVSGFNYIRWLLPSQTIINFDIFRLMGMEDYILSNYNISIVLFLLPFLIGLIGFIVSKACQNAKESVIYLSSSNKQMNRQENKLKESLSPDENLIKEDKSIIQCLENQMKPKSRPQFLKQLFKRILLQASLYGLMICGYLAFISIIHSVQKDWNKNLIIIISITFVWVGYSVLLCLNKSAPIDLRSYLPKQSQQQLTSDSKTLILTGFGEFRQVYHLIVLSPDKKYCNFEKIYLLLFGQRIIISVIIVIISPLFKFSPSIIIGLYLILLVALIFWNKKTQSYLSKEERKSLTSFLYKNYTLRQTINFTTIILIESFFLVFQVLRETNGDINVMTTNLFTTRAMPLLILSILLLSLALNLAQWIWQLRWSQIFLKTKITFMILFPKNKNANAQLLNKKDLKVSLFDKESSHKSNKQKKINLKIQTEDENMQNAINDFVTNSLIFKNQSSPYAGMVEKQSTSRPFILPKVMGVQEQILFEEPKQQFSIAISPTKQKWNKIQIIT